ncbi:MAG: nitroreductase family protein, partial [Candidatus Thermoplasmatota archaeon]|nr:nitroreductase family protein [Candidatus Thermoplasmatota archaeon]
KKINIAICTIIIIASIPVMGEQIIPTSNPSQQPYFTLPPPPPIEMILEESICRRMSVRSFTTNQVSDEELSTILWAAYGTTENGTRTIYSPDEIYSSIIYVIRSDATYKYIPENHSLALYKNGNYLHLGQYTAPIKFGLVWDMNINADEMRGMAEIGMIGQNIYFNANALDLGVVTTGLNVDDLYQLGIPANEKPAIIMPLGHPATSYDFTYNPLPQQNLPPVINNTMTLTDTINNQLIVTNWEDTPLSLLEQSQLIWSSYGYSYLIDNINTKRHRTLPSAIGIYPYKIYVANHTGVYQYIPNTHSITPIILGDKRTAINNSIESQDIKLTQASWIITACLDTTSGTPQYQGFWYYETGAITHNILLEATALNLGANVIYNITDANGLRTALGIPTQTHLTPLVVIPIGNPILSEPPATPEITGPGSGNLGETYTFTANTTDPEEDNLYYLFDWGDDTTSNWLGPYPSGTPISSTHIWNTIGDYLIKVKAKDSNGATSEWSNPITLHILEAILEIKLISGSLFKIKSAIKNNDLIDITDVHYRINLNGGIILLGKNTTGTIPNIPTGETTEIQSNTIIGFGPTTITISAEIPERSTRREQTGFIILFYINVKPGG